MVVHGNGFSWPARRRGPCTAWWKVDESLSAPGASKANGGAALMKRRPSPGSLAPSSAAALSTRNISTRGLSIPRPRRIFQSARHRARYQGVTGGGEADAGTVASSGGRRGQDGLTVPSYGHYCADYSKEPVIQKTGAQEGVFPSTGPGICRKPPRGSGDPPGPGPPRSRERPNTLSTPASTSASRNLGGGTAGGLCAMAAAAPASPASRKPGGDTAIALLARFWRASGKAGALPGRLGVRPLREHPLR